jgi:hypothetical protein
MSGAAGNHDSDAPTDNQTPILTSRLDFAREQFVAVVESGTDVSLAIGAPVDVDRDDLDDALDAAESELEHAVDIRDEVLPGRNRR